MSVGVGGLGGATVRTSENVVDPVEFDAVTVYVA
jgi:hypothetical protein